MIPSEKISVFIMAGGKSRRFGSDKTLHTYRGKPLISHVYDAVSPIFESITIVADDKDKYGFLNTEVIPDVIPGLGPLGGIHSALTRTASERIFVFGADMPFINRDFISYMAEIPDYYDAVVPQPDGYYEPLHAIYRKSCLGSIEMMISSGRTKITELFGQIELRPVSDDEIYYYDESHSMFSNINRPQDAEPLESGSAGKLH
jgi:molybdopterin-guanine dinucleotide biosynthesis protein A